MRPLIAASLLALVASTVPATAATADPSGGSTLVGGSTSAAGDLSPAEGRRTSFRVTTRLGGLDHPWDVQSVPGYGLLVSERERARLTLAGKGGRHQVAFPRRRVWVSGETGLMGLAVDPHFSRNHRFYACHGGLPRSRNHDVRVVAFRLNRAGTRATQLKVLLKGIGTTSGRHGGCRLLITRNGSLLVGTGDAAVGTNPQDLHSLNGKTLRLNRFTGAPWPGNRWAQASNRRQRYIHTYGHRNVQGLAERRDGSLWSAEHGPDRDDEVNRLRNGGNYGWNPVPGYNESVKMTDFSLPGRQYGAAWRSGYPTVATSGASFVRGSRWRSWNGTLAVAALKAGRMIFLRFDDRGHLKGKRVPAALTRYGRLRAVTVAPNKDLLVTTDNGSGRDRVLRISPR